MSKKTYISYGMNVFLVRKLLYFKDVITLKSFGHYRMDIFLKNDCPVLSHIARERKLVRFFPMLSGSFLSSSFQPPCTNFWNSEFYAILRLTSKLYLGCQTNYRLFTSNRIQAFIKLKESKFLMKKSKNVFWVSKSFVTVPGARITYHVLTMATIVFVIQVEWHAHQYYF